MVDLLPAPAGAPFAGDVTDRAGRLLGVVGPAALATWDVSDRAARALGLVGPAALATWDVSDRAARLLGRITAPGAGDIADLTTLLARFPGALVGGRLDVNLGAAGALVMLKAQPADLVQTTGALAANTGATLTLPAGGAGTFHYITHLSIRRAATALLAGGALLAVTTTNLGGRTWRTGNQASITVSTADGMVLIDAEFAAPLKSAVANTATTIVLPAPGAAVSWTADVSYYVA